MNRGAPSRRRRMMGLAATAGGFSAAGVLAAACAPAWEGEVAVDHLMRAATAAGDAKLSQLAAQR